MGKINSITAQTSTPDHCFQYLKVHVPTNEIAYLIVCFSLFYFKIGLDVKSEACQRFFRDGLTISFTKILTDEAVSGWKFEIHVSF